MMSRFQRLLATGFGLGLSPVAPGTAGSLLGVVIVYLIAPLRLEWQLVVACGLVIVAIPICDAGERLLGRKDDGRIVADEYLAFPLCMLGLPLQPGVLLMAFVTCRFFDIVKPPPARQCEALKGGLGIVLDDVVASLYSLGLNHLLLRFAWPCVVGLTGAGFSG